MKRVALHWQILIALLLGFLWAVFSAWFGFQKFTSDWIDPFGDIFLRLLKMIAVPLVALSVIHGVSGLGDIRTLGKLGIRTLLLYLTTTVAAVTIGLVLVNTIRPGESVPLSHRQENRTRYEEWVKNTDGVELIDGGLTDKIAAAKTRETQSPLQPIVDVIPDNVFGALSGGAMLQIISFSVLIGIGMIVVGPAATESLRGVVVGMNDVLVALVNIVMNAAPFFVFCLVAGKVGAMAGSNPGQIVTMFQALGWYSITIVLGLAAIVGIVYPLVLKIFRAGDGIKQFFVAIAPAQMLAFSSSSSAATLPVTIECVQNRLGVRESITGFVLPIGATVNMDGTSLYQAVAVVFLAQFHMIDLTITQQLTIVVTATLASIGAAAVPSAGLVTLILVMQSVGLNPAWISIIVPVDRLLDMCRTVVNVTGDATVATVMDRTTP